MAVLLGVGSLYLNPRENPLFNIPLHFQDVSKASGALNNHSMVQLSPKFENIMPWLASVGASVAAGDFDNNGLIDFYVTNAGRDAPNRLFRHLEDGTFEDVASHAGVTNGNREGASMDAIFFDYDNDRDQDLYVVKWGEENTLFENRGDGTFQDVTQHAGVGYWGYANGVIAFDYNRDGLLDIFIANYFAEKVDDPATGQPVHNNLWAPVSTRIMHTTFTHATNGGANVLYKNRGDGTFEEVTQQAGLGHTGWSLDAGTGDLNNDGWPDLYIANDFGADELYLNTGASAVLPRFRLVIDNDGHPGIGHDWWKGMNVDMGDVDRNGWLDIYVTNILARRYKTDEGNMLWLNFPDPAKTGGIRFFNKSREAGTHDGGWGWGGKFADFNNDGWLDIFAVNGFVTGPDPNNTYWYQLQEMVTQTKNNADDVADWPEMGDRDLSGYEPSRLFIQMPPTDGSDANGHPKQAGGLANAVTPHHNMDVTHRAPRFVEMAEAAGITDLYNGRGIALSDYDNDGDIDFYIANQGAASSLYQNNLLTNGPVADKKTHWVGLTLVGNPDQPREVGERRLASSRDAVGTRIELWINGIRQIAEINYFNGFASQSDKRVHLGLGQAEAVDRLVITWPSGRSETIKGADLPIDQYHAFVEGLSTLAAKEGRP
jgi:hypothetical protein